MFFININVEIKRNLHLTKYNSPIYFNNSFKFNIIKNAKIESCFK